MSKLTLSDVANLQNEQSVVAALNANNTLVETAVENTISRDGTSPNQMGANLDMNSHRVLNLPSPVSSLEPLRLTDLDSFVNGSTTFSNLPTGGTTAQALVKNSNTNYDFNWATVAANARNVTVDYPSVAGNVARTLDKYTADVVNVMSFGALGNLSHDDTSAIQSAITYAETLVAGSTGIPIVYFPRPPNGYLVSSTLTVNNAICLKGDGGSVSVINTASNVPIISIDSSGGAITGLTFQGLGFRTDNTGTSTSGLKFITGAGCHYVKILDCNFYGVHNAIWYTVGNPGFWWTVTGNTTVNNGSVNVDRCIYMQTDGFNGVIANNTFGGVTDGIYINGTSDIIITSNEFNTVANGLNIANNPAHIKSTGNEIDGGSGIAYKLANVDLFYADDLIGGSYSMTITNPGHSINIDRKETISATIAADTNDFNPTGFDRCKKILLSSTGSYTVTGIKAFGDTHELEIYNASSSIIKFASENAASTLVNRIAGTSGASIPLAPSETIKLRYNPSTTRWNIIGDPIDIKRYLPIPAGGTQDVGLLLSTTGHFGVFFGVGAPTLSAAKGSLYLRSDGSGVNDRMYVNTNGATTWTAVVTVA